MLEYWHDKGEFYLKKMSREEVKKSILKYHNHSWYEDVYMRNRKNLGKVALFYRGTKITYGEFFKMVEDYARALKTYGIKKGDEFVACLRQTPDYPALVAAASLIGAKINLIAADFNQDYIAQIIHSANADIVLVDDWDFATMKEALHKSTEKKKIILLPVSKWDKLGNPYAEITERFFKLNEEELHKALSEFSNVEDVDTFLENGVSYRGELNGHGKLGDPLAITYTSGSTKKGIHKGVVQRNETYIIMGRYHDPEVAGIPRMDKTTTMAAIGPHADTTMMSGVSDTLLQGGTVALEPIVDENYFLYSLKINNGGLVIATRTYWMRAMKETYTNPEFKGLTLPYLYVPSEGGEPLAAGEEKALNRWLRDVKAGIAMTHTPVSVAKMTIGGGDSEHGSIFLSLYRGYQNPLQKVRKIHEPMGLDYYDFADVAVLNLADGTYCEPREMGRLVANSPTAMKEYHNDPEATSQYFITDAYGRIWGDLGVYGYVDEWNKVYIKGRIGKNDPKIKTFQIADEILKDTKNIMSCEVVVIEEGEQPIYVAHIETQYFKRVNEEKTLLSAEQRCYSKFPDVLRGRLYFRVHSHEEGFPTLFTAKRNLVALKEEGISEKCIIPSEYYGKQSVKVKKIEKKLF